jgi:hypothetical protein
MKPQFRIIIMAELRDNRTSDDLFKEVREIELESACIIDTVTEEQPTTCETCCLPMPCDCPDGGRAS